MDYQFKRNKYNNLQDLLQKTYAKSSSESTHTRIPNNDLNIKGGSYTIGTDSESEFWYHYHDKVFKKKQLEYLTERQLKVGGPILVDLDFRYAYSVKSKQHSSEDVLKIIILYLEKLKEFFVFEEDTPFPIYVMEKPHVNRLDNKEYTKDGIHIKIGIQMDSSLQMILRDRIMKDSSEILGHLPLTNDFESVFDKGISEGGTNWQLYGSRKPENEAYELAYYYNINYDSADSEFQIEELDCTEFDVNAELPKISARYPLHPSFQIKPDVQAIRNNNLSRPKSKVAPIRKQNSFANLPTDDSSFRLENINNKEVLQSIMDNILDELNVNEYLIKELHELVQILPGKYYEPGSHLISRQVAFALKSADERLFYSWIMLRSKADDFDYSEIPTLYHQWSRYFEKGNKEHVITYRSINFWAKNDSNPEDYERVKRNTVNYYIEQTLDTPTEYDFAKVLYHMYKDKYVCSSMINKIWYVYENHHWKQDKGNSLRNKISEEMYDIYRSKHQELFLAMEEVDPDEEEYTASQKRLKWIADVSVRLKHTTDKNNIFKEVHELFYDEDFSKKMDENRYLVGCRNGVIDLKNSIFRNGYPNDYITKSTNINYIGDELKSNSKIVDEINDFMDKLFPVESLRTYVWKQLAATLIGENRNQAFNIYRGSGSNGKSLLTDLMSFVLGEYYADIPVTLVTEKRVGIGNTSSEIMQLKGVRFALMQEPSKDARINEGMMKQLTGDSKMQARALYHEAESFAIQFHLVVCTNTLFEVGSNDDGTWRRIRVVDFMSKFVDDGDTLIEEPKYKFKKDPQLKEKLTQWAPVFLSMLTKLAFETQGIVTPCDEVMIASNQYRQGQDHISGFINEMVISQPGSKIGKRDLMEQFKIWFQDSQGNKKQPKGVEIHEQMTKKYGMCKKDGWHNVGFMLPDEEEDDIKDL
jgi:P4 family phage/plasmid primase-like protien